MKKYNKIELQEIISRSKSLSEVLRGLGLIPSGGNYKTIKRKITSFQLDTSHFIRSFTKRPSSIIKIDIQEYLQNKRSISSFPLKKRLFESGIFKKQCSHCQIEEWNGLPAPLELDHIDGDCNNNLVNNLRILCPNCHAQTPTYRGKNHKHKRVKTKRKKTNQCLDCKTPVFSHAERCKSCSKKLQSKKFEVSHEDLYKLVCVDKLPFTKIGIMFGVSDNAIRKRCKLLDIDVKSRREKT